MTRRRTPGNQHQRTRRDHASELAEDYVEAVAEIIEQRGVCRVTDLAERFAVSHVSVNRAVARLQRDGYLTSERYRPVELTAEGKRLAKLSQKRHGIVYAFLRALGVSEEAAAIDTEGIEHHVSEETLQVMEAFVAGRRRSPS
ncbi:MAG: manganese-binding transcriptional regulator MntR [Pirellulaceae bacterium]